MTNKIIVFILALSISCSYLPLYAGTENEDLSPDSNLDEYKKGMNDGDHLASYAYATLLLNYLAYLDDERPKLSKMFLNALALSINKQLKDTSETYRLKELESSKVINGLDKYIINSKNLTLDELIEEEIKINGSIDEETRGKIKELHDKYYETMEEVGLIPLTTR